MCGIAGKLNLNPAAPVGRSEIDAMLRPIAHRGPDGQGVYLDGPVGLGHLRLSFVDLSALGDQPMANEDETVWIIFNGEIYNYRDLRTELLARGHVFRSHSDTETIIHAYEEYGTDCLRHLRGMFTFAIWDRRRHRLFIARDRVGIKPLYYCQTKDAFYFSSEFKAILADPAVSREISAPALRQFFSFSYPTGGETLFKSIRKLPPGNFLVVEDGQVTLTPYWDLVFTQDRWNHSFEDVVEELQTLLASTVRDHMLADVPVGVLLSGGVDSTAVVSFAVQGTEKQVQTFTVGFDGHVVDERPYALMAANRFGTLHRDLSITADDFRNFLPAYVRHMEEPVCEPPAVALYYVSKLARQHVKALLSGEGGDEAFAGYPNYPNMLRLERIQRALGPLARPAGVAAGLADNLLGLPRLRRYADALGRPLAEHYFSRRSYPSAYFNRYPEKIFTPGFLQDSSGVSPAAHMREVLRPAQGWPLLDQMLYADTKTWLPDDLLVKADKITMANSLELRVPLLDHKVLEFAASLPADYKVRGGETKRALKAAFSRKVPEEILTRKKAGFPVPYDNWLRNDLAGYARETLLSDRARSRGYFQMAEVERLLAQHKNVGGRAVEIFSLLVVELWHREFVDGGKL